LKGSPLVKRLGINYCIVLNLKCVTHTTTDATSSQEKKHVQGSTIFEPDKKREQLSVNQKKICQIILNACDALWERQVLANKQRKFKVM